MVDGFHVGGANNAWNYMGDGCVSPIGWWSCGRRSREGKWSRIARKVHSLENRPLDSSTEDEDEVFGGPRGVPKWIPALTRVCERRTKKTTLFGDQRHTKRAVARGSLRLTRSDPLPGPMKPPSSLTVLEHPLAPGRII